MENQVQITQVVLSNDEQAVLKANMERLKKVKAKGKSKGKPKRKRELRQATNSLGDFFPK